MRMTVKLNVAETADLSQLIKKLKPVSKLIDDVINIYIDNEDGFFWVPNNHGYFPYRLLSGYAHIAAVYPGGWVEIKCEVTNANDNYPVS